MTSIKAQSGGNPATGAGGRRRLGGCGIAAIVAASVIVGVLAAALVAGRLIGRPAYSDPGQELAYRLHAVTGAGQPIRNAVMYVAKGDGSWTWSGAAGIANQESQARMTTNTPIFIASVTKLYTAAAIMRMYEQGALSLEDPVAKYLPDDLIGGMAVYQGHDYSHEITIAQLLSQTSGLPDYYEDSPPGGKSLSDQFAEDPGRAWTVDETLAWARNELKARSAPGTDAYYSDTNYQLLGKVIEAVTGKPLETVFDEFFFQPLNLKHTWLVARSQPQARPAAPPADVFSGNANITRARSNGAYWADGGIVSTPEDMVAFLKALREGKIVRKDTLELMHQWRPLANKGMPFQYGYGTMDFAPLPAPASALLKIPPIWGHSGSTGSFLYYSDDLDLYMAGTVDQTEASMTPFILMIRAMIAARRAGNTSAAVRLPHSKVAWRGYSDGIREGQREVLQ